jgi:hypothetical protein
MDIISIPWEPIAILIFFGIIFFFFSRYEIAQKMDGRIGIVKRRKPENTLFSIGISLFVIGLLLLCILLSPILYNTYTTIFGNSQNKPLTITISPSNIIPTTITTTNTPVPTATPNETEQVKNIAIQYFNYLSDHDIENAWNMLTKRMQSKLWKQSYASEWSSRTIDILELSEPQWNIAKTDKSDCYITAHVYYEYLNGVIEEYNDRFYILKEENYWKIDGFQQILLS